jgi:hypothetical protein
MWAVFSHSGRFATTYAKFNIDDEVIRNAFIIKE